MSLSLIIDMPSGISGDMLVAALLELTNGEYFLRKELPKLSTDKNQLPKLNFQTTVINKNGIQSRQVKFNVPQHSKWAFDKTFPTENKKGRCLKDIFDILEKSNFSNSVVKKSKKIFDILATAEGEIHGLIKEEVHFHEIGSLDAICDVISSVLLIEKLGIKKVFSSPIYLGQGIVNCAHGQIPVPVPAVVKMAEMYSIPVVSAKQNTGELSTPTGVAILCGLAPIFSSPPNHISIKSAHGAGQREIPGHVNVLRIRLIDVLKKNSQDKKYIEDFEQDRVWQMESNIDDMTGEELSYFTSELLKAGVLESWLEPIIMKKGRPAQKLIVLVSEEKKNVIVKKMLQETSTLGVRFFPVNRVKFKRKIKTIVVDKCSIKIKVALLDGQLYKWKAEVEDVIKLCQKKSISWAKANVLIVEAINQMKNKFTL